jgi:hypothetical protein
MSSFVKTLIGDRWNVAAVAGIVLVAYVLAAAGRPDFEPFLVPVATLAGIGFLARR